MGENDVYVCIPVCIHNLFLKQNMQFHSGPKQLFADNVWSTYSGHACMFLTWQWGWTGCKSCLEIATDFDSIFSKCRPGYPPQGEHKCTVYPYTTTGWVQHMINYNVKQIESHCKIVLIWVI